MAADLNSPQGKVVYRYLRHVRHRDRVRLGPRTASEGVSEGRCGSADYNTSNAERERQSTDFYEVGSRHSRQLQQNVHKSLPFSFFPELPGGRPWTNREIGMREGENNCRNRYRIMQESRKRIVISSPYAGYRADPP
jgi:hypothetical protein